MGKILVHEFISLDGVIEEPRWTFDYGFDPRMGEAIAAVMGACRAILLGRKTYEMFAPAWSKRTAAEDPGAPFMNESTKYVVSGTLTTPIWKNTTIVGPYSAATVRSVKERVDGGLYVSGSGSLVRAMLRDGLVDELHLFMYPIALGKGRRLFADDGTQAKFALTAADRYDNGVIHLGYRV